MAGRAAVNDKRGESRSRISPEYIEAAACLSAAAAR
jgi:hypothetical protein